MALLGEYMEEETINEEITSQNETEGTVETNEVEETSNQEDDTENLLQVQNKKLYERAKKAELELKELKQKMKPQNITNQDPMLTEELRLIARGLSDEEIDQAKVIAKGKGIALQNAIKDPLFVAFQNDLKEREKKENAKLGASKGSSESPDDSLIKPGMSRNEHMEVFKKIMGK